MSVDAAKELENLYSELQKYCKANEHEKVLKTANRILHHHPQECLAFQCKIVSLLLTEKYEEVLKQLSSTPTLGKDLQFEKAYAEYRLKRNSEALTTIRGASKQTTAHLELEAQVLFRDEQFEDAHSKYRALIKECNDDYEDERLANMTATIASLLLYYNVDIGPPRVPDTTYELKYNKACYLLGKGEYEAAVKVLKESEVMLRETFENDPDITQQEVNNELAPLQVQLAYAFHKLGQVREANEIYQSLIKHRPDDPVSLAVAANNIVCLNRDQNIFDSRKRIKVATAANAQSKLTNVQRFVVLTNEALFYYYTNQAELCRNSAQELISSKSNDLRPVLIYVSQLIKDKQLSKAVSYMEDYYKTLKNDPAVNQMLLIRTCLCLSQLYLLQGSISKCCQVIKSLPDEIISKAGFTSTLYTLYCHLEDREAAGDCLNKCVHWHREQWKKGQITEVKFLQILTLSAKLFVRNGNPSVGVKFYEEALKMKPNDTGLLAKVIHAYSQFDRAQAEKMSQRLETKDTLTEAEVDNLESAFLFGAKYVKRLGKSNDPNQLSPKMSPIVSKISPDNQKGKGDEKKKKKRKKILPKNYDPTVTPDLERWLPRQERSYYRSRRKDKRNILRGPQGQAGGAGDLDASQPHSVPSPRPGAAPASTAATASPKTNTTAPKPSVAAPVSGGGNAKKANRNKGAKRRGGR